MNTLASHHHAHDAADELRHRHPYRAGQFYPATAQGIHDELARLVVVQDPKAYKAVLLPHAAWKFCGETIGLTLGRVRVPQRVIVIGPKHTGLGPALSMPRHETWVMPDAEIEIDADMRRYLHDVMPEIASENHAHEAEHSAEVLLPFLHKRNSRLSVLPIAVGSLSRVALLSLAQALRQVRDKFGCLLVVSSDLNHFAPDAENQRRDRLALQAIMTGKADVLLSQCLEHDISMCGQLPMAAVMWALGMGEYQLVDYRTSAAVSGSGGGDPTSVVGYAGMLIS